MQFMMLPRHDREVFTGWEDDFRHILAWMETVRAPQYPKPIDAALAARGRRGLRAVLRPTATGPTERGTLSGEGGVDRPRRDGPRAGSTSLTKEHREWMKVGWLGFFGRDRVETEPADTSPPLDGIWASAPYLHNGSVPTLEHLPELPHPPEGLAARQGSRWTTTGAGSRSRPWTRFRGAGRAGKTLVLRCRTVREVVRRAHVRR